MSALGAGGMGEVYRARDGTLQRDVALKILPNSFATDPERLARFRRDLAERWKPEGCKEFDEADTPAEVGEAARQLRCAIELSELLDRVQGPRRERSLALVRVVAADQTED